MRRRTISWVSLRVASCCTMGKESMNELSTAWGNLRTNFSAPASGACVVIHLANSLAK